MAETQHFSGMGVYTTPGAPVSPGTDEVQTLIVSGTVTAGTYRLGFQGFVSSAIAWNTTTAQAETALNNLKSIAAGGTGLTGVVVTGGPLSATTALTVTFSGTNVAKRAQPLLVLHTNSLTGGGTIIIAEGTAGVAMSHSTAPVGATLIRTDTGAHHTKRPGPPAVWTVT